MTYHGKETVSLQINESAITQMMPHVQWQNWTNINHTPSFISYGHFSNILNSTISHSKERTIKRCHFYFYSNFGTDKF